MKAAIAICALAALSTTAAHAADKQGNGPAETAANFVGQLYGVKPEQVEVTIIKREGWITSAVTRVEGQPTCALDLAPAPEHVQVKYGWLVGSMVCDKTAQQGQG